MKIQSPWMGRIKGSAGNMTGCKVYDKNVMRAKAFEVSNPNTQAQQTQRSFFASLVDLCSDFSDAQLRTLFPAKPKTMSRRNAFTKQIAECYQIDGTSKSLDLSKLSTIGNAPVSNFGYIQLDKEDSSMSISISSFAQSHPELSENYFIVAAINVDKEELSITTECEKVNQSVLGIRYPQGWSSGDEIKVIPLVTDSKTSVALSGFGSFIIKVRPEKK